MNYFLQKVYRSHCPQKIAQRIPVLLEILQWVSRHKQLEGSVVLEVGTGWQPINALLLYLLGDKRIYTYDHVRHVRLELADEVVRQLEVYVDVISAAAAISKTVLLDRINALKDAKAIDDLFVTAAINYRAPADATQSGLLDASVDIVYSYAVLEHVSPDVVGRLARESKRILAQGGIAFHAIGLHDHYSCFDPAISKVNFLRYPEWLWRVLVKNKISFHNRFREKQFISIFRSNGAEVRATRNRSDPSDLEVLSNMRLDKQFRGMTPEELAVNYSEVILSFDDLPVVA